MHLQVITDNEMPFMSVFHSIYIQLLLHATKIVTIYIDYQDVSNYSKNCALIYIY